MTNHSHYHCWEQKQPPACGLNMEHQCCCLCGESRPKDWREEFDKQCCGKSDGEKFAFIPLTLLFIENTRKDAVQEALEEVETSVIGAFGLRFMDEISEKAVLDIIRKYKESI